VSPKTRSILRKCSRHVPPVLQKEIDDLIGPLPEETLAYEDLWASLTEAVLANDHDDAIHYLERLYHSRLSDTP
jgi:hypothetical protein